MILTMKKVHLINRQVGTTFDYQKLHNVFQNIDLRYPMYNDHILYLVNGWWDFCEPDII